MAVTFERLQDLVKAEGIRFYLHPTAARLGFQVRGVSGLYDLRIALEQDGTVLQIHSRRLLECSPDHPHLGQLLHTLATIDHELVLFKLGWEPVKGEVIAYTDALVGDAELTQQQVRSLMGTYLVGLERSVPRLQHVLRTGLDPGPVAFEDAVAAVLKGIMGASTANTPGAQRTSEAEKPLLTEL